MRSHHFKVTNFVFLGCRITQMVTAAVKLKDACPLEEKLWQCMKKQRHHFANKVRYSQGYGVSSSHVWMWELDHKEGWVPKNWCFWTVVLEKTLESPWDSKEMQSILKEINPQYSLEGLVLKLELQYFGHLMDSLEKTLMLGRVEAGGEGSDRWLDRIIDSMEMSLSKLWEIVKDRKPGILQSMGSQRVGHDWATEQQLRD